jgi:hypothetical protein
MVQIRLSPGQALLSISDERDSSSSFEEPFTTHNGSRKGFGDQSRGLVDKSCKWDQAAISRWLVPVG